MTCAVTLDPAQVQAEYTFWHRMEIQAAAVHWTISQDDFALGVSADAGKRLR
jgi:hypothetical protein